MNKISSLVRLGLWTIVLLVCSYGLSSCFKPPQEKVEAMNLADQFFAELQQGNVDAAYSLTSTHPRLPQISPKELTQFVQQSEINSYDLMGWSLYQEMPGGSQSYAKINAKAEVEPGDNWPKGTHLFLFYNVGYDKAQGIPKPYQTVTVYQPPSGGQMKIVSLDQNADGWLGQEEAPSAFDDE